CAIPTTGLDLVRDPSWLNVLFSARRLPAGSFLSFNLNSPSSWGLSGCCLFAHHGYGPSVLAPLSKHDLDMCDAPHVVVSASHRRRTDALHTRAIVRHRTLHVQIIDIDINTLFGTQVAGIVER